MTRQPPARAARQRSAAATHVARARAGGPRPSPRAGGGKAESTVVGVPEEHTPRAVRTTGSARACPGPGPAARMRDRARKEADDSHDDGRRAHEAAGASLRTFPTGRRSRRTSQAAERPCERTWRAADLLVRARGGCTDDASGPGRTSSARQPHFVRVPHPTTKRDNAAGNGASEAYITPVFFRFSIGRVSPNWNYASRGGRDDSTKFTNQSLFSWASYIIPHTPSEYPRIAFSL